MSSWEVSDSPDEDEDEDEDEEVSIPFDFQWGECPRQPPMTVVPQSRTNENP